MFDSLEKDKSVLVLCGISKLDKTRPGLFEPPVTAMHTGCFAQCEIARFLPRSYLRRESSRSYFLDKGFSLWPEQGLVALGTEGRGGDAQVVRVALGSQPRYQVTSISLHTLRLVDLNKVRSRHQFGGGEGRSDEMPPRPAGWHAQTTCTACGQRKARFISTGSQGRYHGLIQGMLFLKEGGLEHQEGSPQKHSAVREMLS